jgi:hypothetical protein
MKLDIGLKDYRKSGANPNDLERIRFPVGTANPIPAAPGRSA